MGVAKKPYGPWAREMFAGLRKRRLLKVEALVQWLLGRGIRVDRTLVSHWMAGRSHLPADLLPLLAAFTGRAELVFGPFVRPVGCDVVNVPQGSADAADLAEMMLEAGASLGRLQQALIEARAPESPGGEAITAEERAELGERLNELLHQLADLRARLTQDG